MLDKTCMAWLEYFPVPIQTPNYVIVLNARIKRISALRKRTKVLDFIIFISNYQQACYWKQAYNGKKVFIIRRIPCKKTNPYYVYLIMLSVNYVFLIFYSINL